MARRPSMPAIVWGIALWGSACRGDNMQVQKPDATFRSTLDAQGREAQGSVLAVDFTVTACPNLDPAGDQCRGTAPLTMTFVALGTGSVSRFLWDFGDGQDKPTDPTPSHTFTLPGTYDVSLLGVGGGNTTQRIKKAFVVVTGNPIGGSCDVDSQCLMGLNCVCGSAGKCNAAFTRGICSRPCATDICPSSTACVDLSAVGTQEAPWRRPLCLPECVEDKTCTPGQRCRLLPERGSMGVWRRTCFADYPLDIGAACRSTNGKVANDPCATGLCADLGAMAMCSLDCTSGPCPPGTSCADFGTRKLCIRPCTPSFSCREDPLLACVPPDGMGSMGFSVKGAGADATFCAPRRCQTDLDCGPSGRCVDGVQGGSCVLKVQ